MPKIVNDPVEQVRALEEELRQYRETSKGLQWEILINEKPLVPTGVTEFDIQFPKNGGLWAGKKMTIRTKGHRRSSEPLS